MKKTIAIAVAALMCATASNAVVVTYGAVGSGDWDTSGFSTYDPASYSTTFFGLKDTDTTGVGTTFDITGTMTVTNIQLHSIRYYDNSQSITIDIYKDVNRGTSKMSNYMVASNLVSSIEVTPPFSNNSGSFGVDILNVELEAADQFTISGLDDPYCYYMNVHMTTAGSSGGNLLLWNYVDGTDVNSDSAFAYPGGGEVTDRELGMTISGVIPEPATIGLVGLFGAGVLFVRRRFMV